MTCPYLEPDCKSDIAANAQRCRCGRYLKRCAKCAAHNRAFANFCRSCGKALPSSKTNWPAYRGGSRRLGLNPLSAGSTCIVEKTGLQLSLGDSCRSLLGYDGHLVAISVAGAVEIADPLRAKSVCRFLVQGPITAEPCIHDGVLYLATRGQLSAYAIGGLTFEEPRARPLWQLTLNGTPIQAVTAVGERLYVTLASTGSREVQVIEGIGRQQPTARSLHHASKVSWVAADPTTARAVFFSEGDRGVHLHVCEDGLTTHPVALRGLREHPIAILGGSVFGIFGDAHRLYRIDSSNGRIEEALDEDTQLFALTHDVDEEWDRDGVLIDNSGISFTRAGVRDTFEPHERVKSSPLIVRTCAVAVGMEDGRVRIYDLAQLPRQDVWYVGGSKSAAAITALASFDSYIAAGNRDGVVEVSELRAEGSGR